MSGQFMAGGDGRHSQGFREDLREAEFLLLEADIEAGELVRPTGLEPVLPP